MQLRSIQQKITLWAGLCLFFAFGTFLIYATAGSRSNAMEEAQTLALETTRLEAAKLKVQIDRAFDAGRNLAQVLKATKDKNKALSLTRADVNTIMRNLLAENPQFFGVYTVWEPDAFDKQDAQYVNTQGHDQTGRFIPAWVRNTQDEIYQEPLVGYAEKDGASILYQTAKRSQKEVALGPLPYPIQGKPVLLSAQVVPLVLDGQFFGVVGVLIKLDFVHSLLDRLNLYESTGQLLLVNQEGLIVGAARRPELTAKPLRDADSEFEKYLLAIRTGREVVKFSGNALKVMAPVKLGQSDLPWAVCLTVPLKVITARVDRQFRQQAFIGLALVGLTLCFLWYFAGQLAKPMKVAVEFANQLSLGLTAKKMVVKTADETGAIAGGDEPYAR